MSNFFRYCILSLFFTVLAACSGGGGGGGGNNAPVITSNSTPSLDENSPVVIIVTASDADGDSPTFTITGGADAALLTIDNLTGELTFITAPDFEFPADAGADNIYNVQVTADDSNGGLTIQNIIVTVTNVAGIDAPSGIYQGTMTPSGGSAETAIGLITSNGKLMLFGRDTNEAVIGNIIEGSISGALFSGSVKTVTGNITSASGTNITGTYDSGTGAFDLNADQALYARGASFAKLTGTWVDNVFTTVTGTTTWTFQSSGSYAITSTTSCNGTGGFYLIDATKNEYEMDLTITNCGPINGAYTGIAMMSKTFNDDDTLTFMFINGGGTVGGLYEPIRQ